MGSSSKIFSWFILSDKALTWDILCRKGREGPGRCYLCNLESETNLHIGVDCKLTQSVWYELEVKLHKSNLWAGDSVSLCLKNWFIRDDTKLIKSLPILVLWFIWLARNKCCFEDLIPSSL